MKIEFDVFPPKGAIIGISLLLVAWMTGIAGVIVFRYLIIDLY